MDDDGRAMKGWTTDGLALALDFVSSGAEVRADISVEFSKNT